MKGQQLSELLNNIDDDLISDAMPPAWKSGKVKKAKPTKKERHPLRALGDFMDSGWAAAVLSVLVSVGVLSAIVWAGRMGTGNSDPSANTPGGQIDASTDRLDVGATVFPDEDPSDESLEPSAGLDGVIPLDCPVWMHIRGGGSVLLSDHMVGLESSYLVYKSVNDSEKGESYEADGAGAIYRLPELMAGLLRDGVTLEENCIRLEFTPRDAFRSIQAVVICDTAGKQLQTVQGDAVDTDTLCALGGDGWILVVQVVTAYQTDTYVERSLVEYPIYVTFDASTVPEPETFAPPQIEGYPSDSVTIQGKEAMKKALYGDLNLEPDSADMQDFTKRYCSGCSEWDVSIMIRLLRSVPVPLLDGAVPDYVNYFPGVKGLCFQLHAEGMTYQFNLILDATEANQLMTGTLSPFETPIVLSRNFRIVAQTGGLNENGASLVWTNLGGVLAKTSLWPEEGFDPSTRSLEELFLPIGVEMNGLPDCPEVPGASMTVPSLGIDVNLQNSVTFDAAAVDKVLMGGLDPYSADDMESFVGQYAPSVSPEDAAEMLRLMRALPVPIYGSRTTLPATASADAFARELSYAFSIDGIHYRYTLIWDSDIANEQLATLSPIPELYKIGDDTVLLSIASAPEGGLTLWVTLMEDVLARIEVKAEDGRQLREADLPALFAEVRVLSPRDQATSNSLQETPETETPTVIEEPTVHLFVEQGDGSVTTCEAGYVYSSYQSSLLDHPALMEDMPTVTVAKDAESLSFAVDPSVPAWLSNGAILDGSFRQIGEFADGQVSLDFLRSYGSTTFYLVAEAKQVISLHPLVSSALYFTSEHAFCLLIE